MKGGLSIRTMTRRTPAPGFPFEKAAKTVLPGWDLSLAFVGETRAKAMNLALRKKAYVPNVLSYETTGPEKSKSGEIIICPAVAKRQAPSYGMPYETFVGYLFIHGLFHLKGMPHGHTMERAERDLLSRIAPYTHATTHRHRNRHRHLPDKGRRR
jgi:rRNA maturation RNase YbeY